MSRILAKESTLVEMFGVSDRRVREVCKNFKVETGKYLLIESVSHYIKTLRDEGKQEMANLRKADTELKEFRLKILKKEHVPISEVELGIADMQIRAKSKALSIANKASLEILGKTNRKEIEIIIQRHVNDFLKEMANSYEVENDISE
ncbi:MAG: hypothetical protein ACRCWM_09695 [Sarcina sp.]|uniref:hypothetical protein n=1 Tax=Cetobacterium sp. TaxID=2071632 RepID=UPI0025C3B31C|nr:hypothetical protein [Cetobacterium sp.]